MHAVAAFFASIIAVVSSVFTSPAVAPEAPVDSRTMHAAAAAATQIASSSNPFFDPSAPPVAPADTAPTFSPPPPQTVINQPVIERIIERVVPQGNAGISADKLTAILTDFGRSIEARLTALNPPKADIPQQVAAAGNSASYYLAPASQRIDQLSNTTITSPTITGGSISNTSISGYLPTSGGTLSGALSAGTLALSDTLTGTDATFSGTLTAGTLNVAGLSSQGALIGPYFRATSTTATSTFAGGFTAASSSFNILQNGYVGIGTANPTAPLWIRAATNENIFVYGHANMTSGVSIFSVNDANSATQPMEFSASKFGFFAGLVGLGQASPVSRLDVNGGVTIGSYSGTNAAPTNGLIVSGNVGIGTTTPTDIFHIASTLPRLYITDTNAAADNKHWFLENNGGALSFGTTSDALGVTATRPFTIVNDGRVGIGVSGTNPQAALHVARPSGPTIMLTDDTTGHTGTDGGALVQTGSSMYLFNREAGPIRFGTSNAEQMRLSANGGLSLGSGYVGTDPGAGSLILSGNVGIGTTAPGNKLVVSGGAAEIIGTSGTAGRGLKISTFDTASTDGGVLFNAQIPNANAALAFATQGSERVRITGTGNVGIGTTSPDTLLTLQSSASATTSGQNVIKLQAAQTSATVGSGPRIVFTNSGVNSGVESADIRGYTFGSNAAGLAFGTGNNNVQTRMVIDNNGNVGIGTTTPVRNLHVHGNTGIEISRDGFESWGIAPTLASGNTGLGFRNRNDGVDRLWLGENGNIGIGTTTPANKLHIYSTTNADGISIDGTTNPALILRNSGALKSYFGLATAADAWLTGASANDTIIRNDGGNIHLGTNTTPRFSILSTGNVGIGTTTPGTVLEVASAGSGGPIRISRQSNSSQAAMLSLVPAGTISVSNPSWTAGLASGASYYSIATYDGGGTNHRLVVDTNGNVGIGTTTPNTILQVVGAPNGTYPINYGIANISSNASQATGVGGSLSFGGKYADAGDYTQWASIAGLKENSTSGNYAGSLNFYTRPQGATIDGTGPRMTITSTGNVGIGTTSPNVRLQVQEAAGNRHPFSITTSDWAFNNTGSELKFRTGADTGNTWSELQATINGGGNVGTLVLNPSGGNVGIGTTTPGSSLTVGTANGQIAQFDSTHASGGYLAITANGTGAGVLGAATQVGSGSGLAITDFGVRANNNLLFVSNGASTHRYMVMTTAGNVGIGTTTPTAQFSTTGTVRFAGLGSAGANLVTDALGNVTASSDERLKDKQGDFTRGLTAINAISPVLYKWRPETGFDTQSTYAGFFAQNVQFAIPEAVSQDSRGHLTLADRPILAALVNATKEIGTITGAFKSSLIAWLGSASNGIGDLFAKDIYATNGAFDTTSTRKLCITDGANDNAPLCLTKSQLAALLGQSAAANLPLSVIPHAPELELNGNASSTIEIGDTYNDLGARIVAPESDLNLGLVILLDGATTTQVSIDTSTPGEHTILYTVTSPTTGLTGSIMRTILVRSAAEQLPVPVVEDDPFTSPPANDNDSQSPAVDAF